MTQVTQKCACFFTPDMETDLASKNYTGRDLAFYTYRLFDVMSDIGFMPLFDFRDKVLCIYSLIT